MIVVPLFSQLTNHEPSIVYVSHGHEIYYSIIVCDTVSSFVLAKKDALITLGIWFGLIDFLMLLLLLLLYDTPSVNYGIQRPLLL